MLQPLKILDHSRSLELYNSIEVGDYKGKGKGKGTETCMAPHRKLTSEVHRYGRDDTVLQHVDYLLEKVQHRATNLVS